MWVIKLTGKGSQKAKEARCQVAVVQQFQYKLLVRNQPNFITEQIKNLNIKKIKNNNSGFP